MSDPSLEEESLISQEDIDRLLDSSSIDKAEETLEIVNDNNPELDELGELSQDDIDSLMGGNDPVEEADEMGELSQDDIDSLMGGNDPVEEADEMGELSQDDIDGLMGGNDPVEEADEMGELSQDDIDGLMGGNDPVEEADEMGELSQDDIDSLMGGNDPVEETDEIGDLSQDDTGTAMGGDDQDMELISSDDIDQLMNPSADDISLEDEESVPGDSGNLPEDNIEMVPNDSVIDDYVIDDSDALDVSQCLIAQETLDELIRNAQAEDLPDPVVLDSDEMDSGDLAQDFAEQDKGFTESTSSEQDEDELESLLNTDLDDAEFDLGSTDSDDVSQEDIDALLQESDEEEDLQEDEDDILISQNDIDTLLMAADQEDEDLLGDLMGDDMDAGMDDDFNDEDILENDEEDSAAYGDQVVLEGGDDMGADDMGADDMGSRSSISRWKNWYKSKLVIATASAILVLGISVPSVYFLFFSGEPAQIPERMPVPLAMEEPGRNIEVASVDIDTNVPMEIKKSGNIILSDFVVLAADLSKEMAYVTADISIDYSDQRAYHEINENLSFYRDLIYESIQKNLVWEKRNEVTEADLIWGIETTLKKVLPSDYIERVSFKSFKAS